MLNAARRARLQRGRDAAIRETAGVASQKPKGQALQKKGTVGVHGVAERSAGRSSKVRTGQWPWIWQCGGPRSPKGRRVEESQDAYSSVEAVSWQQGWMRRWAVSLETWQL